MNELISFIRGLISIVVPIVLMVMMFKFDRFKKMNELLDKIFYIELINKAKTRGSIGSFIKFAARFFQCFYIFAIIMSLTYILILFDPKMYIGIIPLLFMGIIFPFMVRLLLLFQFKVHGIK